MVAGQMRPPLFHGIRSPATHEIREVEMCDVVVDDRLILAAYQATITTNREAREGHLLRLKPTVVLEGWLNVWDRPPV